MPRRAGKPCGYPGCGAVVAAGRRRCQKHQGANSAGLGRPGSTERGYGHRWQQARVAFLREHPLCVMCEEEGRTEPATEVDHIRPHRGDAELFWDPENWQGLCKSHHSQKTAREGGQ